ncbi:pyridoxal-phosphate dependent enzyme [Leucobacter allii]|uniref:pyridoxal-phosphate dependent enzyme n=1 Tax=Leucobacter allii TaxID=2932247 RepID=UPI001FD1C630|nr:pyridoxal-phosphate dependent enzyme [Leucobacter allii]UOR01401.1 pyridoxal-phosphate dependent enzyme [Leucobacter allii]
MTPAYVDPADGRRYPLAVPRWRGDPAAGGPEAGGAARGPLRITPHAGLGSGEPETGARGVWRYRAALPVEVAEPISLGEGGTPLVPLPWAGAGVLGKLEWCSPTGSFKDRGASVMLSVLRAQGVDAVIEDSSGNGGAAVAAYAAAGGMRAAVFAPASTSPAKLVQARAHGARIELVDGPREAAQAAAIAAAERGEGCYASHNWQAFFLEGTKSLAYEIWEDLGRRAPDCVVLPVGAGSSLLGCAIGFGELLRSGRISRLPRLYAAQPLHCSPLDAAHRAPGAAPRPVLPTVAEGAAIARPLRLRDMLDAVRESAGGTVAVSEAGIRAAHAALAARGLYVEPTSATAAAGLAELRASGDIGVGETAILVLTGSGLKTAA